MLKFLAILLAIALSACGHKPNPSIASKSCPTPLGIPNGKLLLFGEMHGSIEAPNLISNIACSLSSSEDVAVGLEIPSQDQPLIDKFLESQGTSADITALTSSEFWQKGKDGRSSKAMLQLIKDIRSLRENGRSIQIFAFDDQPNSTLERNIAIANGIRRFQATHKNMRIIALMGNIHAMQGGITTENGPLITSAMLLSDLNPVSITITNPAGTIWACKPDCGIQSLTPRNQTERSPGFNASTAIGGYSYSYHLASITASPPAVQSRQSG